MYTNAFRTASLAAALLIPASTALQAQTPGQPSSGAQAGVPRQSGTVKAITPRDFVLTTAAGQDIAVTVPEKARVLLVAPGSRDLASATPGKLSDVAAGDRVIVNGTAGDSGPMLTAVRVIVMKSGAIAATHEQEQAAWQHGLGGIVKGIDASSGAITVSSGMRTLTITTSPSTIVRRYAGGSVRFEDAVKSTASAIQPGDQIRARGQRSEDGATLAADEIVTGSFSNFSGIVSAVDPAAGTVTLKDLATKKTVTVALTSQTSLRRLPAGMGPMGNRGQGAGAPGAAEGAAPGGSPQQGAAAGAQGGGRPGGPGAAGRAGMDLSRMLARLPTETPADLKQGDAVMIVASNNGAAGRPTAITLLSGVEQILAASPSGETTLSPWSLGNGGEAAGGMEGGAGAPSPQ